MDSYKIEYFREDHPDSSFPHFKQLGGAECRRLCEIISTSLLGQECSDGGELCIRLDRQSEYVSSTNATSEDFSIRHVLDESGITPLDEVFLNWGEFDEIDQMAFNDVDRHFEDIWYPHRDDLDIFDQSGQWLISVDHDGYVKMIHNR
jgi:hypothetical protein